MQTPDTSVESRFRIEGMDCPSCASNIEKALRRVPGLKASTVNYSAGILSLNVANAAALAAALSTVKSLGYRTKPLSQTSNSHAHDQNEDQGPWWRSQKARITAFTAALIVSAFLVASLAPQFAQAAYATAAILGLFPFGYRAVKLALAGVPFSIETLMTAAAIGAVAIGDAEEAVVVIFLFAVGELLENVAAGRARAGIKALMNLVPRVAFVEKEGQIREVPIDQLAIGDLVRVRPGDRVPSDGEISEGESDVDESPVTGESVPVAKVVGSLVYAGSINVSTSLRVRVTHTTADNTIAKIIHLVEEAQSSKAPTARFIERFSAYYTPGAMAVSALIIWCRLSSLGATGTPGFIAGWRLFSSLVLARL